jgi:hypothetical protein
MSAGWFSKNRIATSLVSACRGHRALPSDARDAPTADHLVLHSLVSPHCASAKIDAAGALAGLSWVQGARGLLKLIQPFEVTQTLR